MRRHIGLVVLLLLCLVLSARGDTLKLKDGKTLEGRVIPQGEKYWIKTTMGETKIVNKSEVVSFTRGGVKPATPATPTGAPGAPTEPAASAAGASLGFAQTKSKADRVDVPLVAIALWQSFIDANPTSGDLPAAKAELEKWRKLDKDKAEKINGKWVGGEERKKLIRKVNDLLREAARLEETQTLKAVGKLEEAVKLYPNSFEANLLLGHMYLTQAAAGSLKKHDAAIAALELATKLRPNSAAAWSNLGIAYNFREKYEQSVLCCYKAAQIRDTKEVVQNLVNSISQAPPGMRANNTKVRPIMEEALLLARKHGVADGRQHWIFVRPSNDASETAGAAPESIDEERTPGVIGNGSGFLVTADGYLMTNRHVANEKDCTFICRFADGTQKPAEVVAVDDDADIAIMKVKADKPLPFLQFAPADEPGTGAECAALGFPVGHAMNYTMQMTAGTISSVAPSEEYALTLTAKITHGNSGGPLVDKFGNVIGVVSAGLTAFTETYGKALSAGQVREFLEEHADKLSTKLAQGSEAARLDTEAIYKKASPATVCILLIRTEGKD
jgi:S1-C subfamily serine protease